MKSKKIIILIFIFLFSTINLNAQWKRIYDYDDNQGHRSEIILYLYSHYSYLFASKGIHGILRSTDLGSTWQDITQKIGHDTVSAFLSNNDEINIACVHNGIFYSHDNGNTWFKKSEQLNWAWIRRIIKYKNKIIIATTRPTNIYVSEDDGITWQRAKTDDKLKNLTVHDMAVDSDFIYIAGLTDVFYSQDGLNWRDATDKDYLPITSLFVFGQKLFAGTGNGHGIFVSTNNGETWEERNSGLPNYPGVISDHIFYHNMIFINCSTDDYWSDRGGVFYSKDTGKTWINVTHNIRNRQIFSLALIGDYLFCNIPNPNKGSLGGIYRAKIDDLLVTDVEDNTVEISKEFYAARPYPNPASNFVKTKIYWNVNYNPLLAKKNIYNIYGQKLNDETKISITNINNYSAEIIWNCSKVPNGLYFIAIQYFDKLKTIPVILSK